MSEPSDVMLVKVTKVNIPTVVQELRKNEILNGKLRRGKPGFIARTSVPKDIYNVLGLKRGDELCWIAFKNGVVTVTKAHRAQEPQEL